MLVEREEAQKDGKMPVQIAVAGADPFFELPKPGLPLAIH
jgi:hypothetical protein